MPIPFASDHCGDRCILGVAIFGAVAAVALVVWTALQFLARVTAQVYQTWSWR